MLALSCFTCFATAFLWVDAFVLLMGDSQHFTFNLDQFQVDILGAFFDVCKICFQRKCITVRIDCSKEFSKESNCSVTFEVL